MKYPLCMLLGVALAANVVWASDDEALVAKDGKLLFEDSFNRDEAVPDKEDIGAGWTSNSGWRAGGRKQVDLLDGTMHVVRVPEANHGVAIFHDAPFQDGAVRLKFKLEEGEDFGLDFVDREEKSVHAGHLCMAHVTLSNVVIQDSKTGGMNLDLREKRLNNALTPEDKKLIASKSKSFPNELEAGVWHEALVVVQGDAMRVNIDGKEVGEFHSEGMAHPTKRWITLAVNKGATFDDLSIYKLK